MLERNHKYLIVQNVPADVCQTCGERYFDSEIAGRLSNLADKEFATTEEVSIKPYPTA